MHIQFFGPTEAEIEEKAQEKINEKLSQIKTILENDIYNNFLNNQKKLDLMLEFFKEYQNTINVMQENEIQRLENLKNTEEKLKELYSSLEENGIERRGIISNHTMNFYILELGYQIHSPMITKFKQNETEYRNPEYLEKYKNELADKIKTFERFKAENNNDVSGHTLIMLYPFDLLKLDSKKIDLMHECLNNEWKISNLNDYNMVEHNILNKGKKELLLNEFEYIVDATIKRIAEDNIELYNNINKLELSLLPIKEQGENTIDNYEFEQFLKNYIKLNLNKYFDYKYEYLNPVLSQNIHIKKKKK